MTQKKTHSIGSTTLSNQYSLINIEWLKGKVDHAGIWAQNVTAEEIPLSFSHGVLTIRYLYYPEGGYS